MALDIIIVVIFLITTLRGKAKGIGDEVISLIALVGSIVLGSMFTQKVGKFFMAFPIEESIARKLQEVAQADQINLLDFVPKKLASLLELLTGDSLTMTVDRMAELLIYALSFILIVFVVWSIASFLKRKLRISRSEGGFFGTVDSTVGLLFGAVKGAILVMLLLACMFPIAGIFAPDKIPVLTENLNHSIIAGPLYDMNPLITLTEKFLTK